MLEFKFTTAAEKIFHYCPSSRGLLIQPLKINSWGVPLSDNLYPTFVRQDSILMTPISLEHLLPLLVLLLSHF